MQELRSMKSNLKSELLNVAKRIASLEAEIEAGECEGCDAAETKDDDFTAELEAMLADDGEASETEESEESEESDQSSSSSDAGVEAEDKLNAEIEATEKKLASLRRTATELKTFNRTGITDVQTSAKSSVDATNMSAVAGRKPIEVVKASLNEAKPKIAALAEKFENEGNLVAALHLDKIADAIESFTNLNTKN